VTTWQHSSPRRTTGRTGPPGNLDGEEKHDAEEMVCATCGSENVLRDAWAD
jgi:hypothetical protein